jgi:signal transduction histidine kinase
MSLTNKLHVAPLRHTLGRHSLVQRLVAFLRQDGSFLSLTLVLRCALVFEVISRPLWRTADAAPRLMGLWWPATAAFAAYVLALVLIFLRSTEARPLFTSRRSKQAQLIFDLLFCGLFYVLNGRPESNLVLTFWLPLMLAARYFSVSTVLVAFGVVIITIGGNLIWLAQRDPLSFGADPPARVFILRSLLFVCLTWPLVRYERVFRRIQQQSEDYQQRMDILVGRMRDAQRRPLDELITLALEAARSELKAELVSLFVYENGVFRRRNVCGAAADWFADEQIVPGEGLTGQVARAPSGTLFGTPVRDNRAGANALVRKQRRDRYEAQLRSGQVAHVLAVPLDGANRTFGILRALNKCGDDGSIDPHGFTDRDEEILSNIALLLALSYAARRREDKVHAVLSVADIAMHTHDQVAICERITTLVVEMGYACCCVRQYGPTNPLTGVAISARTPELAAGMRAMPAFPEQRAVIQAGAAQQIHDLQAHGDPDVAAHVRRLGVFSVLLLPLYSRQQVTGLLEIYTCAPYQFFADECDMLETFAAKASVALTSARLGEQNDDQIRRLKMLTDAIHVITSSPDHASLFEQVANRTAALLGAEDCSVFLANHHDNTIDLQASYRVPHALFQQRYASISTARKAGLPSFVAATKQPLWFCGDEYRSHPAWSGEYTDHLAYLPSRRCRSLLIYPILNAAGELVGVLRAENKTGPEWQRGFTEADRELLELLTVQVAVAIEKIDQVAQLEHLLAAAHTIASTGARAGVLDRIVDCACDFAQADLAAICPYDAKRNLLLIDQVVVTGQRSAVQMHASPHHDGLTQQVLESPNGVVAIDDLDAYPGHETMLIQREGVRSCIAVALRVRNQPVGILYYDFRRPHHFTSEEIRNARDFGDLAAIALGNANTLAREQQTNAELRAVQDLTRIALEPSDLDSVLGVVVQTVQRLFNFEICTISLVNQAERMIETRKGVGIPAEWKAQARHTLESDDIQAIVVRTARPVPITGYDARLDPDMYTRYHHERLTRVFMPIIARSVVIGTVEAGYDRSVVPEIDQQVVEQLKRILEPVALVIDSALMLEQARTRALQLQRLQAVSQQMHTIVSSSPGDELLQVAAHGIASVIDVDAEVSITLAAEQAMLGGAAETRRAGGVIKTTSGRCDQAACIPAVVAPLQLGSEYLGELRLVLNQDHWFSHDESQLLELGAAQIAIAIRIAREQSELNRRLDLLAGDIDQTYHKAIGQPLINLLAMFDNLLDPRQHLGQLTVRQVSRLERGRQNLLRLQRQIDRLLMARQIEEKRLVLERRRTPVHVFVQAALDKVSVDFEEKGLRLTFAPAARTLYVDIDADRLEDVLCDILTNAYKYTPAGGQVHVCIEDGQYIRIGVRDTGRGIAPEDQARVFEKFVQLPPLLKSRAAGAGLGLYLARTLIEAHGGRLTLESARDAGSTFTIWLPRAAYEGGVHDSLDSVPETSDRDDRR